MEVCIILYDELLMIQFCLIAQIVGWLSFAHEDRKLLYHQWEATMSEYRERVGKIQRLEATHGYYETSCHKIVKVN